MVYSKTWCCKPSRQVLLAVDVKAPAMCAVSLKRMCMCVTAAILDLMDLDLMDLVAQANGHKEKPDHSHTLTCPF